ncbi:phage antirepressor KilAC domain-containing protein [Leptotrichia trevisanii]|uniref:phage antirepressor n=1 Tax=Leptotrichia trevisanii TaxID=109328 RepID=UPI0026EC7705|nr:phage antirepressor KilAC domain-containing protein [Leptotrichia trevisanii]
MNKKLTVFENEKFGKVRVVTENEKPYFNLNDVCEILGLKNPRDVKTRLNQKGVVISDTPTKSGIQQMNYIDESNFYKCIFRSNKPEAEAITEWVTGEVLPTIRKTGMYVTDNVWDTIMNDPEKLGEVLINYGKVKKEKELLEEENQIQKQLIAEYKPIKEYVDTILSSEDTMTTTQIAADYGFSAYELNKTLNEQRVVRKVGGQWILYIEHMNKGYTKSETMTVKKKDGTDKVVANTKWTQKGRLFIHNLLENLGIKANMDREKEGA